MQVLFQRRNFQLVYILCAILADSLELIVPTIENGDELRIRVFLVNFFFFFYVFRSKSGTTNNHRNGSSDSSY